MSMKIASLAGAALLATSPAFAADLLSKKAPEAPVVVSPWDYSVGGGITSNYLFRGISQSNNQPSGNVNAELRFNVNDTWQLYAGSAVSSIKLTNQATSPTAEIDLIGGVRATVGSFTFDVGAIRYHYPYSVRDAGNVGPFWYTNPSWTEGYGKVSYALNDSLTFGINAFFTPSYLDFGSSGSYYSGTVKYTIGDFALSGELGRQTLGRTDTLHNPNTTNNRWSQNLPDYNYWNVGVSYTYKLATFDLRYFGTDMNKTECGNITGKTNGDTTANSLIGSQSKYCGTTFVGTLSFALSAKDLK